MYPYWRLYMLRSIIGTRTAGSAGVRKGLNIRTVRVADISIFTGVIIIFALNIIYRGSTLLLIMFLHETASRVFYMVPL
jgi:hypothetical protein